MSRILLLNSRRKYRMYPVYVSSLLQSRSHTYGVHLHVRRRYMHRTHGIPLKLLQFQIPIINYQIIYIYIYTHTHIYILVYSAYIHAFIKSEYIQCGA